MRDVALPQPAQFDAAWDVVRRHLPVTPVVAAPQLGERVSIKLETVQPTGSFKVRGGLAAVAATLASDPGRAVVGASAGNHGLGLAYAAAQLKADVTVVVPRQASAAKVSALKQFDVHLVQHGSGYSEAEALALALARLASACMICWSRSGASMTARSSPFLTGVPMSARHSFT